MTNEPKFTAETIEQLNSIAAARGQSASVILAELVAAELEREKWRGREIQQAIDEHRRGEAKYASHDDVGKWVASLETNQPTEPPRCT